MTAFPTAPLPPGIPLLERGWPSANNVVCIGPHGAAGKGAPPALQGDPCAVVAGLAHASGIHHGNNDYFDSL